MRFLTNGYFRQTVDAESCDMDEKRKSIRRFTAMNIECFNREGTVCVDKCLLVNISKGGIAMESKKKFRVGEKLRINFTTPDNAMISILAEILRVSPGGFGILYGAKYNDPDLKNLYEFNRYLLKYFNLY